MTNWEEFGRGMPGVGMDALMSKIIAPIPQVVYVVVRVEPWGDLSYIGGVWWREENATNWAKEQNAKDGEEWRVVEYGVMGEP